MRDEEIHGRFSKEKLRKNYMGISFVILDETCIKGVILKAISEEKSEMNSSKKY